MTPQIDVDDWTLRAWRLDDAACLVTAWADADIARWNAVPPNPDLATARRWIMGVSQRDEQRISMDWVIDMPTVGVVGEVGLSGFSCEHNGAQIGYWLMPARRGTGLATRAVQAISTWAHQDLKLDTIVARCHPDNPASGAVVARVGYRNERHDSTGHELWISRTRGR